jgi:ribonuclease-3 family protein
MQAKAMDALEEILTDEEKAVAKRGRNTKSQVPKSATVRQYRQGTAFEALVGYLYLLEKETRLEEILDFSFAVIQKALQENGGKKK